MEKRPKLNKRPQVFSAPRFAKYAGRVAESLVADLNAIRETNYASFKRVSRADLEDALLALYSAFVVDWRALKREDARQFRRLGQRRTSG